MADQVKDESVGALLARQRSVERARLRRNAESVVAPMNKRALISLGAAVCLAGFLLLVSPASGAVYWTYGTGISAANMDGSNPWIDYYRPSTAPGWSAPGCGVAVNGSHLYMRPGFEIARVSLDGSPVAEPIVQSIDQGCGLAIDSSYVYWNDRRANTIGRAGLDGAGANTAFISGVSEPYALAVDGQYIYWTGIWGIGRARLDGTEVDESFIELEGRAGGLAVDGQYIYWGRQSGSAIGRAKLNGEEVNPTFIPDTGPVFGIATNSTHLFWANEGVFGLFYSSVGRAGLNGSNVERFWIPDLRTEEFSVAVDSRPEPPPISLRIPSRPIRFGKMTQNRMTGVTYLDVIVPARGELAVTAPRVGWRVLKGNPPDWVGGVFTWHLKIWPGANGAASKRLKKQLKRKGPVPLKLHLTYSEENRGPISASTRIVLSKVKRTSSRHPLPTGRR